MKDLFSQPIDQAIESLHSLLVDQPENLSDAQHRKIFECIQILKSLERTIPIPEPKKEESKKEDRDFLMIKSLTPRQEHLLNRIRSKENRLRIRKKRKRRNLEVEFLMKHGIIMDVAPEDSDLMELMMTRNGLLAFPPID